MERFRGAQLTKSIWLSTDSGEVGPMSVLINLSALLDEAKSFGLVRQTHCPQDIGCPKCCGEHVVRDGHDDTQPHRQRYLCNDCQFRFDDPSRTALAGHHQPPRVWISCLYFIGLNLSNRQIAQELSLNESGVQEMTTQLREGFAAKTPPVVLSSDVEIDEVYVVAGHKGNPAAVGKKAARADATD
jgi:transposase-like protein